MQHLITVDRDDDVHSINAKVTATGARRVGLIVPGDNRELKSPLVPRVLAKRAIDAGVDLAIITRDPVVRRLAREAGLRDFATLGGYRSYRDHGPGWVDVLTARIDALSRGTKTVLALGMVFAFFGSMIAAAYLLYPSATVVLSPAADVIRDDVEIVADPEARAVDVKARRVPARVVVQALEATDQTAATGVPPGADGRLGGNVTIQNRTAQPIAVPAGTVVIATTGAQFTTEQEARVPASGTARVAIRAVAPGAAGAVARLAINRLVGPLQNQVVVLNEEATGVVSGTLVVSDEDRERVRSVTLARLRLQALDKARAQLQSGETLIEPAFEFTPIDEFWSHPTGAPAQQVTYRVMVRTRATYYNTEQVESLARDLWQPAVRSGFRIVPDQNTIGVARFAELDGRAARLRVPMSTVAVAEVNRERVEDFVRWRPREEAEKDLARVFTLAEEPRVSLAPTWASRAMRVNVFLDLDPALKKFQARE